MKAKQIKTWCHWSLFVILASALGGCGDADQRALAGDEQNQTENSKEELPRTSEQPECRRGDTDKEGWYDPGTDDLICTAECVHHGIICPTPENCGTGEITLDLACEFSVDRPEGWYIVDPTTEAYSEGCTTDDNFQLALVAAADCNQVEPGTNEPPCEPQCLKTGTSNEGWYDCKGNLLCKKPCDMLADDGSGKLTPVHLACEAGHDKPEGWYVADDRDYEKQAECTLGSQGLVVEDDCNR